MRTCLRCLGVLVVVLVLAAAGVYWFVSTRGVSARDKPLALEAFIARHLRRLALPAGARPMTNPLTLSPPEMADAATTSRTIVRSVITITATATR